MDKFLLKLLDQFSWLYKSMKMDYAQLRAIVATKLLMDNRRQRVAYRRSASKSTGNSFGINLVFYTIFGGLVAMAMSTIASFIISMIVFYTYIMVMISMTLITDFSSILLDTSDNTIILPRPVDSRTLFAARLTHILLYLGQLGLGLTIIPAIVVTYLHGLMVLPTFFILVVFSIITAVVLTNGLYLILMQFVSEEKLKSIINYFQIFMAVVIMAGYQILPRMIERIDLGMYVFEIKWWSYLLPPVWMAGTIEAARYNYFDTAHAGLAVCAFAFPIVGVYAVNRYLSPVFNRKIASLGGSVSQKGEGKVTTTKWLPWVSGLLTRSAVERGVFELVYRILGRDRKIRLKIYPAFGYMAVFGMIFMMRSNEDLATTWVNLPYTQYHLMLLYLTFMVLQVALYEVPYSDDFKASWIYFAAPLGSPGVILSGMIKAVCTRLFLPGYAVVSSVVFAIWGAPAIDDIVIAFLNNLIMVMLLATINKKKLPFSIAPDVKTQSGNLVRSILSFLVIGGLGLTHYVVAFLTGSPTFLLMIPVQIVVLYLLFRKYRNITWERLTL